MSPKRDAVVPSESEIIEVVLLFRNPKGIGQLSTKLECVVNWIVLCRKSFAISELIDMVNVSLVSKCLQGIGNVHSGHLPSHRAYDFRFEAAFDSLSNLWSSSLATIPSFDRCVRLIMLLFSIYFISKY